MAPFNVLASGIATFGGAGSGRLSHLTKARAGTHLRDQRPAQDWLTARRAGWEHRLDRLETYLTERQNKDQENE